jgi:hypothetical protein
MEEFNKLPTFEKLKRIALKYNKESIDFKRTQCRAYLSYDYNTKTIMQLVDSGTIKIQGVIYCTNERFKEFALKYINKEELEKYLKG